MKAQRFAFWLHIFSLWMVPMAAVVHAPPAHAQVQRQPTTALGQKVTSKVDEVLAITVKICSGLLVFYACFIVVKFFAGHGRDAFQHLLYWMLGAAFLASLDQAIQWSQS